MSIKLTTQQPWIAKGYASYSKNHPDNSARTTDTSLPDPVRGPAPIDSITPLDKQIYGAWGHKLCCERAYGPNETTTRIKGARRRIVRSAMIRRPSRRPGLHSRGKPGAQSRNNVCPPARAPCAMGSRAQIM